MASRRNIHVVYNCAKNAPPVDQLVAAGREAGHEVTTHRTQTFAEGHEAALQAIAMGCDTLVAGGGDGTLASILSPAIEAGMPVATLPLGTANDFAREIGVLTPEAAIEAIIGGHERRVDVVWCTVVTPAGATTRLPMCAVGGAGVIAETVRLGALPWGRRFLRAAGEAAWAVLAVNAAATIKPRPTTLRFDDLEVRHDLQAVDVLNVVAMGGWPIIPGSGCATGAIHAMVTGRAGVKGVSRIAAEVASGRGVSSLSLADCITLDPSENRWGVSGVQRLEVLPDKPLPVHLMGEAIGFTPAVFEIEPARLRVLAPGAAASPDDDHETTAG